MTLFRRLLLPTLGLSTMVGLACHSQQPSTEISAPPLPPPIILTSSAFEAAANVQLPEVAPSEYPGLHNVFRLGDHIVSGSEPHGEEAFAELAKMGVRTILSVDGKAPEVELAAQHGLRYVHVPIQYKGLTEDEITKIAKTFREVEGPFYVHCFHGQHRGPAGAAIGRIVLDGLDRETAIAEMRQWCSTAAKYEGLYRDVATKPIPSAAVTAASSFDFAPAHRFEGSRDLMISMARHWDNIKLMKKGGWAVDPEHPDLVPLQEATQVHLLYKALVDLPEVATYADDFRSWMDEGFAASEQLVRFLSECSDQDATPAELLAGLDSAYKAVGDSCINCHKVYRD